MISIDTAVLATIVGLTMIIIRLIEMVIGKAMGKKANSMTPKEHEALMRLDRLHNKDDKNGIPLWYVPRSWGDQQNEMMEMIRTGNSADKTIIKTLERIEINTRKGN